MPVIKEVIDSQATPKPTRTIDHNDYDTKSQSGGEGGKKDWESHPAQPGTFTDVQSSQSKPVSTTEIGGDGNPVRKRG